MEDKNDLSTKNYNPFEHREVKKPNSDIRSLANLLKASLGSGILAIPLAFANAGWGVGIVATIIIAIICAHCVHIFVSVSRGCCIALQKPVLNYAETCEAAFSMGPKSLRSLSKTAKIFAEFSLLFAYFGACCIFTVLISESLKQLLDEYVQTFILPVEYYCLILLVPLCLLCQIRYLKWLAPIALLANILLVAVFGICLYYIFKDKIVINDKRISGDIARFPAFLSTVIFAMEGIGMVMPVENSMKKPEHFLGCPSVMVIAMTFTTVLYIALGVFGYFRYGDALRGTITLNLPLDEWPAICGKICIALATFFTYPLHFYVVVDVVTRYSEPHIKESYRSLAQTLIRIIIVCFCGGVGIALPMLEQIINIVGALFYSILGLIIPGVVETIFKWNNLGKYNWIFWKNIFIVLFGLLSLISGCSVAIMNIIENLRKRVQ